MNKLSITLLIFSCANIMFAQEFPVFRDHKTLQEIDSCILSINYRFSYYNDTLGNEQQYELYQLQIGKKYTRYFSMFGERADSINMPGYVYKTGKSGGYSPIEELGLGKNAGLHRDDCLFNYPSKGVLTHSVVIISDREYIYEEKIPDMKWVITNESKEILGYLCDKAFVKFRGRKYNVWFSTSIPIQYGPWKFNGLPGAILLISEESGLFEWRAMSVTSIDKKIYYHIDKKSQTFTSRDGYHKVNELLWKDPVSLYNYIGKKVNVAKNGKPSVAQPGDLRYPYIPPLELE